MILSRGKGILVPLLLIGLILLSAKSGDEPEPVARLWISCVLLVICAAWFVWYGRRPLVHAEEYLGRPLKRHEWFVDVNSDRMPFHSFMFIQLPWWAILYAVALVPLLLRALSK
jgi:hypothetical protein